MIDHDLILAHPMSDGCSFFVVYICIDLICKLNHKMRWNFRMILGLGNLRRVMIKLSISFGLLDLNLMLMQH